MAHDPQTKHALRCFCSRQPLLAYYGLDTAGALYVHLKVHKQSKIYGEVVFSGGVVRIRCRECLRWHRVIFREREVGITETVAPRLHEASRDA